MNRLFIGLAIVLLLLLVPLTNAYAGGGGDSHGNNHAALFVGVTQTTDDKTEPTAGIEYEYRLPFLNHMLGVGVVVERIFSDATIYVAGAVIHPWKALKFNLSFGTESIKGKSKDVVRAGVGYDFHYGNWSYGPVYNLDYIKKKTAHVLGVAVGMGF